ncbi:high mobility group B protein 15 [Rosa rugosa]|uniref:high mobility group B protein 15 n=1 Tax=Rosa rugosa TaxID=74645 RepID=UPI002B414A15|nr:high mobility group B protein 15 [Rosa rugosa]XP_061992300.1 high mobility group B protein 15 [Rosa rugosa]XP_061992301.1 high mobility group B protein 15 [Rosa rugosa]
MAASTSCASKSPFPMKDTTSNLIPYPAPLAKYEEVAANPKLFMSTLEKLHTSMGTKFMIPIIGGRELDLHRLFVEVTSRGGMAKIVRDRRWKEVTAIFNFPSTATNASFVLRKYYNSLLLHYEQIYYFKAQAWNPLSSDISQNHNMTPGPAPRGGTKRKSTEAQTLLLQQPQIIPEIPGAGTPAPSEDDTVFGFIDGKFESGYLVTVTKGTEKLSGVLYQVPQNPVQEVPQGPQNYSMVVNRNDSTSAVPVPHRRRRRKKSEIKRRDPAHPKPNRSGYNFFFAEQHARLKPLHPGKDREISRMIGELWNKLKESDKGVYQEKAVKDKERYRVEMEEYRERLKAAQVISDAVPLQQRSPEADASMAESETKIEETEPGDSPETADESSESSSSKSEK